MNNIKQKLICVVGESCSGKDTIIRQSMAYMSISKSKIRLKPIVSYATRPIRENETNGVEHWFISEEEAKKITGENELLAYTYIKDPNIPDKGYEYFTTLSQLGDCNLYIIDPRGLNSLMKYVNENKIEVCVIFIDCPKLIRDYRAKKRNDDINVYNSRCSNEHHQFELFRRTIKVGGYPNTHVIKTAPFPGRRQRNIKKFCEICTTFLSDDK